MGEPVRVPDRPAYQGDPYSMRFIFLDGAGRVKDMSGADFEITSPLRFDVDTSRAARGTITFVASEEDTASIALPMVRWDIFEHNIWGYTILRGRLIMEDQVKGSV